MSYPKAVRCDETVKNIPRTCQIFKVPHYTRGTMLFLLGNLLSNAKKPFLEIAGSSDTFGFNLVESNPTVKCEAVLESHRAHGGSPLGLP